MRHAVLALASAFTLLFSNAAGAVPVPIDRIVVAQAKKGGSFDTAQGK